MLAVSLGLWILTLPGQQISEPRELPPPIPIAASSLPKEPEIPFATLSLPKGEPEIQDPKKETDSDSADNTVDFWGVTSQPEYWFQPAEESWNWLYGNAYRFGMFSIEAGGPAQFGSVDWISVGYGAHFLDGPRTTDLPPRLFDLYAGIQHKSWFQENWAYELALQLGIFTDFEGRAGEGIRFPSYAVVYHRYKDRLQFMLGAQYLDRDDIAWLPVAGLLWCPTERVQLELVFPRPRAAYRINSWIWIYLQGRLGGGTWAVERSDRRSDVVTYRDLQIQLGWELPVAKGRVHFFEVAYVFDRQLEYRSASGDFAPAQTALLRGGMRY